tara:strand:- start:953 stop:1132 length:180 start_codon:yes stop_codon:yes gene_type:complete
MGLLDDDYVPPFKPKERRYRKQTALSQESRDSELNNLEREEVTEDFSDSPFADRKDSPN